MQVTDARGMSAVEIAALMQKKAFDECELSPGVQAGVTAMFGAPLTAAQVCLLYTSPSPRDRG